MPPLKSMLLILALCFVSLQATAEEFALQDGDTVGFLGDSITAARGYSLLIENYTLLRFPDRRIKFINLGIGGDTAVGGLARLERDVFANGVTVLTVAYGINDIGWGARADQEHKLAYLNAITEIVRQCRSHNVRVYICSAAITGADPLKSEKEFLQTMCDEGMKLARENGGNSIDVQRTMREIQKRVWKANETIKDPTKKEQLHFSDNIHLNDLGQTAMGYAILKGLGAPAEVSSVVIDADKQQVVAAVGCTAAELATTANRLEFTRLDDGLPLNAETFFSLQFRFVPIDTNMNRYLLKVQSLAAGNFELIVDGRKVGRYTARELSEGVNIASATMDPWQPGGPWDAQANELHALTLSRDKLSVSVERVKRQATESAVDKQFLLEAERINSSLEALQQIAAKPRPYHFVIQSCDPLITATPTKK